MTFIFKSDFNTLYQDREWMGLFNPVIPKISFTEVLLQPTFYVSDKILYKINSQSTRNIFKGVFLIVCSPILFSILIVSILWRFVRSYCAANIIFFGIFCVQPWLDVRYGPQKKSFYSAMKNTVAYIVFIPILEVIALCVSLYNVILRDLSLMYKFCQFCGNKAYPYQYVNPSSASVGGVNCDMLSGCHALGDYQEKLNAAFSPSKSE